MSLLILVYTIFLSILCKNLVLGASFKGNNDLESNVKEIRDLLLQNKNEDVILDLKQTISDQSNDLARLEKLLTEIQQKSEIWSSYEHFITSWLDQISAVDRKLDIVIKSQEKLNTLELKLNTISEHLDKIDFDKWEHLSNKLQTLQINEGSSTPKQTTKNSELYTLIDEYTTRGVLSTLNRIEKKVYESSTNGSNVNYLVCKENKELLEDIVSKVDVIVDKVANFSLESSIAKREESPTSEEDNLTASSIDDDCNIFSDWKLIQKRHAFYLNEDHYPDLDHILNFNASWLQYKYGFKTNEGMWIGNEVLHKLSKCFDLKLRVELYDFNFNFAWAEYNHFSVSDEVDGYRLEVSGFSGNATDSLSSHNGMLFSTYDMNNDQAPDCCPCAVSYGSGWWFSTCFEANLNGVYHHNPKVIDYMGIIWEGWLGNYSLRKVSMMIASND